MNSFLNHIETNTLKNLTETAVRLMVEVGLNDEEVKVLLTEAPGWDNLKQGASQLYKNVRNRYNNSAFANAASYYRNADQTHQAVVKVSQAVQLLQQATQSKLGSTKMNELNRVIRILNAIKEQMQSSYDANRTGPYYTDRNPGATWM